jgi:hypothetical protein
VPAHATLEAPSVQTRAGLQRARMEGLTFEEAWQRVVGRYGAPGEVRFPHKTELRREWREILDATRTEWAAAYDRLPTRLSRALDALEAIDESTFASVAGQGPVRQTHVPPRSGSAARDPNAGERVRVDSRAMFEAMFARNSVRRDLRTAA